MVALVVKEQEMKPEVHPITIPREMAYRSGEFCSAFRPVHSEHRAIVQQMLSTFEHPDDTTQVTWSSVHNYRCSVSVTGNTKNCWKQPEYEEISNDSKIGDDDEDEEIDVGSSYDTEISMQSMSDLAEELSAPVTDIRNKNTDDTTLWRPTSDLFLKKKETIFQGMEIEIPASREDSMLKSSLEEKSISMSTKSTPVICAITPKVEMLSPTLSTSQEHNSHSPVRKSISDHQNNSESFGLNWRNPEFFGSNSDVTSPITKSPTSIGNSSESLNSIRDVILRRSSPFFQSDSIRERQSFPSYPTESPESVLLNTTYVLERRRSFGGGGGIITRNPLYTRSYPIENSKGHEEFLQTSQSVYSTDLSKNVPSSVSSHRTDRWEDQQVLYRRSSFGSTELKKISNLSFTSRNNSNTDEDNLDESPSINSYPDTSDGRESFGSISTVDVQNDSTSDDENSSNSLKEMAQDKRTIKAEDIKTVSTAVCAKSTFGSQECVHKNDMSDRNVEQRRKSVVVEAKNCIGEFSAEDFALRSRVLILLWVLLGERRLREVGYPSEPVHRLLWRAVDVCCSVAGVKSAAAVPLHSDHDCGSDMLCFRDHTHRFLEVCAPTREHWKQFGWASLTVDAVVRKIYQEELTPLLRIQSLPPDIQKAATYLAQLDRPTVMVSNPAQNVTHKSEPKQQIIAVPPKKKRGRPAKITHKIEEGGRIERVMLWRFLLNLLEDPKNSPCIHWVQRDEGIFRILNTDWLARLWGRRHGNPRMTYEKMARAMRTYYRSKVLQPVPRLRNLPRKLVYKFNPAVIQKVAAMKLSCSTFTGRGMNYNK